MYSLFRARAGFSGRTIGLLLALGLTACVSGGTAQTGSERQITPEEFFNAFNMRTIRSSMGPRLRYYCESYPKDYFNNRKLDKRSREYLGDEDFAKLGKTLLVLTPVGDGEDFDQVWWVYFEGDNQITLDEFIRTGTWRTSSHYKLYFDEVHGDWRMKSGEFLDAHMGETQVESSEFFNDILPDCIHRA